MIDPPMRLHASCALTSGGWADDVTLTIAGGVITDIAAGPPPETAERALGPVVPAIADLHSHAFQRAMAGLANRAAPEAAGGDSFWTWRTEMYRLVDRLTPEDVEAVAAKLQVELMKGGFCRVVEFHYLYHAADGTPYANPAELPLRILAAARRTGIGLTLLPVFYAHSDFGGRPPESAQRRFVLDVDGFLDRLERLAAPCREVGATLGLALHSQRAATAREIADIVGSVMPGLPIHIHVAEQEREVAACLAHTGHRPVERLFDLVEVDRRWCLVHATHVSASEVAMIAASGAVVGLCPTTEADLGDGLFPAVDLLAAGGRFGVGTDSHVATAVADELRLLEYGQRLRDRRRNRLVAAPGASVARTIFDKVLAGGAQAAGQPLCGIAVGAPADLVVLDGASPWLETARGDAVLDRWIFGAPGPLVRDVMVGGRWRIVAGRHPLDAEIDTAFRTALRRLAG